MRTTILALLVAAVTLPVAAQDLAIEAEVIHTAEVVSAATSPDSLTSSDSCSKRF